MVGTDTKTAILRTAGFLGTCSRVTHRRGLFVYLFHDVTATPSPYQQRYGLATSPSLFQHQIEWICKHHELVHPNDVSSGRLPERAALITFDDGFEGVFRNALPYLEERDIPAVLFLNLGVLGGEMNTAALAAYIGDAGRDSPKDGKLHRAMHLVTPDDISEISKSLTETERSVIRRFGGSMATDQDLEEWDGHPLIRYGNHLWNHYNAMALLEDDLRELYQRNESNLTRFENHISWFAFTFGRYDDKRVSVIEELGATKIFGGSPLPNRHSSRFLHRFELRPEHDSSITLVGALTVGRFTAWLNKRRSPRST